jgi:hypothetical protein
MKKKKDSFDIFSIITLIISIAACIYLSIRAINISKSGDDIVNILLTIISSVFSIGGLIIAVLQIFKVSSNTKTYKEAYDRTIKAVTSNASISLLAKCLEQSSIIKHLFESQLESDSRSYFNNLSLDLTFLTSNKDIDSLDIEKLNFYVNFCIRMDTLVYKTNIKVLENVDYSLDYQTISEMQSLLISIQQKLNTPKEI